MAYLALYRKYRPSSFDEMVGQEKIITVIRNSVKNNKVSHAYLFSGPRGTGKTTTAKIIAKMVNCDNLENGIPCEKCNNCLKVANSNDVIEIDAASNNGVDEIREIRDKVNLIPTELKYKIYIIDEVHMLTTQAFNALLKTLEEPPEHVIFILATTEFYKIPLTIVSRCQRFQFSKIDDISMVNNLRRIANNEKIEVSDDVLYEISRLSDGCCRDAVNLFDQLISYSDGNISLEQLYEISGSISYKDFAKLINLIIKKDAVNIIKYCNKINNEGINIFKFVEEFMFFMKDIISYKFCIYNGYIDDKTNTISELAPMLSLEVLYEFIDYLNELLNKIKVSSHPSILLSVFLLKFLKKNNNDFDVNSVNNVKLVNDVNKFEDVKENNKSVESIEINDAENINRLSSIDISNRINNTLALASKECLNEFKEKWKKLDDYFVDSSYSFLNGILKDCVPVVAAKEYLMVSAKYDSLVDRFNLSYVKIEEFFEKIFNYHIYVVAILDKDWDKEKKKYISNLKNGIKYEIVEIENKDLNLKDSNKNKFKTDLDVLKDLVGNDIIKYVD